MKITRILNSEFNLLDDQKDRLFLTLFITIYLILFLNIYLPFNIEQWAAPTKDTLFITLTAYGIIGGLGLAFSQFVLRKLFNMEKFLLKQFLVWVLFEFLAITLVLTFIYSDIYGYVSFFQEFYFNIKLTFLSAIIPYLIALLLLSLFKSRIEIIELQKKKNKIVLTNEMIKLPDDTGSIKFSLPINDLLYLESTDNYVIIFYTDGGKVKKELLRNSLKNLEVIFNDLPIKRCHRSYMVNLNNLTFVKKSGQKMSLVISDVTQLIQVSKTYQNDFKQYLQIDK